MLLVAVKVRDTPPVSESGSSPEEAVCGGTFYSLNLHSPVRRYRQSMKEARRGREEGVGRRRGRGGVLTGRRSGVLYTTSRESCRQA